MHATLRTFAVTGGALAALTCIGATVIALPVPPAGDETQLERASALDRGYGINTFVHDAACHLVAVAITGADGRVRRETLRPCD